MPDTGHNDEPAIRHCRRHRPDISRRNPAVALTPQHQMGMTDLCHAALKFATLPLAGEVDRRTDPDALGNIKRLYQNSLEQRLDFSDTFAKPWNPVRRKTIGSNSEDAAGGHHRPRQFFVCHHRTEKTDLVSIEQHAKRGDRIEGEHSLESHGLHQEHPRGDDTAGRMRGQVAEFDIERVKGSRIEPWQ